MTIQAGQLERLLTQINGGSAAGALAELDELLEQQPTHAAVLALRAEALRLSGRLPEAVEAYQKAGENGAGARNWLVAGALLAAERKTDDAVRCLLKALEETPDDDNVLDALITSLFNANRQKEAVEFARRQLALSKDPRFLSNAALLLQSTDFYEEASEAFKKIIQLAPDNPAIVGAALGPARFTCEWEWIESLQRKIGGWYDEGQFGAPQEYPLTHLTWCADEARNLGVTRAYAERTVPRSEPLAASSGRSPGNRIRIGYLSCDFRNHATMHLMAGLLESHDRARFEVFAYDYSSHDISDYRQRFLDAVEHHIPIHSLSDRQAAARIAEDRLDILFDLKVYTGGCRPGVLALRPAPLQAAYLGFPGSAANPDIDYIVSDRFVTPDSSTPYYTEKFCRLPHTYQCNDRRRFAASAPGTRARHGLPDDKVVFGAFNQSYKVDRTSFSVWMRILKEVPNSVLWLLGQAATAIANLSRHAQLAGIEPARLIFAPFADPHDHLARLQLADAILDTLVCNGHTTTSDALWAGIPVITSRGKHFASRVSESLLNAIELPELVGVDHDDMVRIAKRVGTDAEYRSAVRQKAAGNRLTAPLFDTARFTRDFETAIEMMIEAQRSGATSQHIDVPDHGPVAPPADASGAAAKELALKGTYLACPLCDGAGVTLWLANCAAHGLWHEPLPRTIEWMRCTSCGHIHSRHFWTDVGRAEVLRSAKADPLAVSSASLDTKRTAWAPVAARVIELLGGYRAMVKRETRPIWVDVGCGDGALVITAADHGFAAVGLDTRADVVSRIQQLGFTALQHEFLQLRFEVTPDVLSFFDVLEQLQDPRAALRKAAQILQPGAVLVLSTADLASSVWKAMDTEKSNPYWTDLERHHNFSRDRLGALLRESGFEVADFAIARRQPAQMEIYAVRC
jgi:protein O-GlcNAc transferase